MTHDHMRVKMANLLREVCHVVKVTEGKRGLLSQPKTIIGDQPWLDVSTRGVWNPFDKTFPDIRVSHPITYQTGEKLFKKLT